MPVEIKPVRALNPIPRPSPCTSRIVIMARALVNPSYYEVVDDRETGDHMVRVWPLDRDDHREPFWIGADQLLEVPGAYVDEGDGYLRFPTRMVEE